MYTFNTQILTNLNTVKENEKYYSILRTAHPEVQFNLGQMYYYGKNILKNEVKAEELFRSAANQGHIGAQIELGNLNHYMANLYLQLGTEIFNNINTVNDIDLSNIYFSSAEIHTTLKLYTGISLLHLEMIHEDNLILVLCINMEEV
jgi:TPR repeat protein